MGETWKCLSCVRPGVEQQSEVMGFHPEAFSRASSGKVFNQMRAVYECVNELGLKNVLGTWLDEPEYMGRWCIVLNILRMHHFSNLTTSL